MTADKILKKYEDDNEYHFHAVDRKWIIAAMEEYATLRQPLVEGEANSFIALPTRIIDTNGVRINATFVRWNISTIKLPTTYWALCLLWHWQYELFFLN